MMKTRTRQMKKLVISWILFYAAGRIAGEVISALSSDKQSAVSVYADGAVNLLNSIAGIIQLVLYVKILGSKVTKEEPHRIKIGHLKKLVVAELIIGFGVTIMGMISMSYFVFNPNERIESVFWVTVRVIGVVSWILIILICYRVLASKAEFDKAEETSGGVNT